MFGGEYGTKGISSGGEGIITSTNAPTPPNTHKNNGLGRARGLPLSLKIFLEATLHFNSFFFKTRQDKTVEDKTRQDKTKQDKTRQDKTRQQTRKDTTQDTAPKPAKNRIAFVLSS